MRRWILILGRNFASKSGKLIDGIIFHFTRLMFLHYIAKLESQNGIVSQTVVCCLPESDEYNELCRKHALLKDRMSSAIGVCLIAVGICLAQSCPWVGLTYRLGWVGPG